MPAQYNQSWTRGFGPWFTDPASDQHMRVSDAERQAVTDRLAEHFSSGRLDQAEFDERVGRAMSATTRAGSVPEDGSAGGASARVVVPGVGRVRALSPSR